MWCLVFCATAGGTEYLAMQSTIGKPYTLTWHTFCFDVAVCSLYWPDWLILSNTLSCMVIYRLQTSPSSNCFYLCVVFVGRNSSVGRALDWRSKGPRFNPGFRQCQNLAADSPFDSIEIDHDLRWNHWGYEWCMTVSSWVGIVNGCDAVDRTTHFIWLSTQNHLASTGLEPATFALLARRSNQLS